MSLLIKGPKHLMQLLNIWSYPIINVFFLCLKGDIVVVLRRQSTNGGMRKHMQGNSRVDNLKDGKIDEITW